MISDEAEVIQQPERLERLFDSEGLIVADDCPGSMAPHFHCDCFYDTSDGCCFCDKEH